MLIVLTEMLIILEVTMKKVKTVKGFGTKLLDYVSIMTVFLLFVGMIYQ